VDLGQITDLFLNIDEHLTWATQTYGIWIYAILFAIVFCETGLVVTPFLPGDSLLFATGAICAGAGGGLSLWVVLPLLVVAAVLGDAVNYRVGRVVGPGFLERRLAGSARPTGLARFIKRQHLERTQQFYEKYGGKTIVLARFVPIVRTFAPFVAGIGSMQYRRFFTYNVVGAIAWVFICTLAGFFFGELPFVKKHFELVVLGIVFVSILPIAIEMARGWFANRAAKAQARAGEAPRAE
jgi:membrane-associated protein